MADEAAVFVAIALGLLFFVIPLYLLIFRKKEEDTPEAEVKKEEAKKSEPNPSNSQKKLLKNPASKKKVQQNLNDNGISHSYLIASLKGHTGPITSLDFSNNGKLLASCSEGQLVYFYHKCHHNSGGGVVSLDFLPN